MSVFIIAEIGVNHNGSLDMAKSLVLEARKAGADAVKFQTFFANELVTGNAAKAKYQTENMKSGGNQYGMLKALELSKDALIEISSFCSDNDIEFLSTPFSERAADLLEAVNVQRFKISSGDLTHLPMLAYIARKGLPMIVSTGMANMSEIEEAVLTINKSGNDQVSILHCVSNYPAAVEDCNLKAMETIRKAFQLPVGWSDHSKGAAVSIAATALGAEIIEKHITLDKSLEGPDHKASMEPDEFKQFVRDIRAIEEAMGNGIKLPVSDETETARVARRSLVVTKDLSQGHVITKGDVKIVRPGTGLAPKHHEAILGLRLATGLKTDTPLQWHHFSGTIQADSGND